MRAMQAQFAELDVLGELTVSAFTWARGTQVHGRRPGPHSDGRRSAMNVERQIEICKGAPFYVLGPLVTDFAPGYDHITSCHRRCACRLEPAPRCCAT